MKLLSKSEIAKAASVDRQREIEEGLKLAKRVDSLREVAAEEDASLEKFRVETLSRISAEVSCETEKRDSLLSEVAELEERKRLALIPIDDKWEEVNSKEESLTREVSLIDARKQELSELVQSAESTFKDALEQKARADDMYVRSEKALRDADSLRKDAEIDRVAASNNLFNANGRADSIIKSAIEREGWVAAREKACSEKEEELRTKEIDIAKEFSLLRDQQQMFIRTKNRK